jgi:hypothetical protein
MAHSSSNRGTECSGELKVRPKPLYADVLSSVMNSVKIFLLPCLHPKEAVILSIKATFLYISIHMA